ELHRTESGQLLYVAADTDGMKLDVELVRDTAALLAAEPPLAHAEGVLEAPSDALELPRWNVYPSALFEHALPGADEPGLLVVPFFGIDGDGAWFEAAQLFSFSDHSVTRRGVVRDAARVIMREGRLFAWSRNGLRALVLDDPDSPSAPGQVDL